MRKAAECVVGRIGICIMQALMQEMARARARAAMWRWTGYCAQRPGPRTHLRIYAYILIWGRSQQPRDDGEGPRVSDEMSAKIC